MDHQCLHWEKLLYTFTLLISGFPILLSYVTSYQAHIFYLEQIYRRDTLYHIVEIQIHNYSYGGRAYFFTYTRNCEQQHNIAIVNSPLKIPSRHNGIIPITIKGHNLKAPVGYFINNQHINRRLDPSIHVINGIYNIKGRSTLCVLVANYTNKHVTFNKGQCIGQIVPSIDHMPQTSINSLMTQKTLDKHIWPDTFTPALYTLPGDVRKSLNQLMETFKSQFAQDETSIATTHLTRMQIDMGGPEPVLQRSYPITMKHYNCVRNE